MAWERQKHIGIGMGQAQKYKSRIRSKKIGSGIGQAQTYRS